MIEPILAPSRIIPTDPLSSTDPLGMNAAGIIAQSEEEKARRKALAKAESEFATQHLAEQSALRDAINQQLQSNHDAAKVPILGDAVDMMTPQIEPIKDPLIPFDMQGGMELRGYLDAEGNATPEGELFVELMDSGIFDERGQLTPKGKAYTMDAEAAEQPENINEFITREKAGLNDATDITFGDAVGNVGGFLSDAIKGAGPLFFAELGGYSEEEIELASGAAMLGGVKSSSQLGAGLDRMAAKIWLDPGEDEFAYYASKQEFKRKSRELEEMTLAEYVGGLMGSAETLQEMESARTEQAAKVGPEKAAEIERQAGAFGQLVLDPSNAASFGAGFFASKTAQGPTLFAKLSQTVEKATIAQRAATAARTTAISANATATRAARIAELASKQADNLASIGDDAAAAQVRAQAARMTAKATDLAPVVSDLAKIASERMALAEKLTAKAGGAQAVLSTIQAAKQARAIPFQAIGATADFVGNAIIKTDEGLKNIITGLGFTRESAEVSANVMKWAAFGGGIAANPLVATVAGALAAGPTMKQIGNMSRIIGKETLAARGTIPFWRRVSQASGATPLTRATAHLLDEFALGARILPTRTARGVAKGTIAAAPVDIAFEIAGNGGDLDANTLKQALAESLVFGGTGGAFGAAVTGSTAMKQRQQMGDEINFRNERLVESQQQIFSRMGKGSRRVLSTYAANFPSLNVELVESGGSRYDSKTLTATINVKQSDWIKPLIAHEVQHYMIDRAQMTGGLSALMLGTEGIGGMLRSADGTLDANFEAAMNAYNDRLATDGQQSLTPDEFAVEYFNESTVDSMVEMAESGELSRIGRMTDVQRFMSDVAASLIDKTPIIRDLAMKLGGARDKGGNMVQGNGLLADGVRELPGAKALVRQMLKKTAGRQAVDLEGESQVSERGVKVPKEIAKGAFADTMISQFQLDENGQAIRDKDGDPLMIDRGTELKRATAGLTLIEMQEEKIRAGQQLPEGSLQKQENGDWTGEFLTPEQIKKLETSGVFNAKQLTMFRMLNQIIKKKTGETLAMVYQAALARGKNGKVRYEALAPTFREVVPVAVRVTKAGNIIIETMSVTQLMENIRARAESKLGKKLYAGNEVAILRDVEAVLDLHKQNRRTDGYFTEKYGEGDGPEYKKFVNIVFGLMTKAQQDINPLFESEKITSKTNVFKSRRLDRINQTAKLQGRPALPFGYTQVKENWFPLGLPPEDIRGVPTPSPAITPEIDAAYMRAVETGDMETAQRVVNDAARQAGYNVGPVFHGTDSREFTAFDIAKFRKGLAGKGFYFSNSRKYAQNYGDRVITAFLKFENPEFNSEDGSFIGKRSPGIPSDGRIIKGGFPGTKPGEQIFVVKNNTQIKSADPVTYDDSGNVIPLSERFPGNP